MRKSLFFTAAVATALAVVPAYAQQQQPGGQAVQQGGQQPQVAPGEQTLEQEAARNQGAQLYVSPSIVRQIQQALNQAGYDPGNVNGQWDQGTQQAVMNFQQANGLEPTGNVNLRLLQALGIAQGGAQQAQQPGGGQGMQQQQQQGGGRGESQQN